jgi:hypothetical protein
MATAMFVETLDNSQHSTRLIPKAEVFAMNSIRKNPSTWAELVQNTVQRPIFYSRCVKGNISHRDIMGNYMLKQTSALK